jgi:hypothetical protein
MSLTTTPAQTPTNLAGVKVSCDCRKCNGAAAIIDARAAGRLDTKGLHNMIWTANDRRLAKGLAKMGPWAA